MKAARIKVCFYGWLTSKRIHLVPDTLSCQTTGDELNKLSRKKKQPTILQDTVSSDGLLLGKESYLLAFFDLLRRQRIADYVTKREDAHFDLESSAFPSGTARTIPRPQPRRHASERV